MPINTHDLQRMFSLIADEIVKKRDWLCELDGVIGDGDHGLAMEGGWQAAATALASLDGDEIPPTAAFNAAAKAFLNAIGASSGPLCATAFVRAGAAVKGKEELSDDDFLTAFCALSQGIQDRGKAELGEKTSRCLEAGRRGNPSGASQRRSTCVVPRRSRPRRP
jgi:dihydroxyacetone kinase-like protein